MNFNHETKTKGAQMGDEIRAATNQLSDEEREKLLQKARILITAKAKTRKRADRHLDALMDGGNPANAFPLQQLPPRVILNEVERMASLRGAKRS